jgi:hypothetical protein
VFSKWGVLLNEKSGLTTGHSPLYWGSTHLQPMTNWLLNCCWSLPAQWFSVPRGCVQPRAIVRLEVLDKLKIFNDLTGNQTSDLPARRIAPQPTTLPRAVPTISIQRGIPNTAIGITFFCSAIKDLPVQLRYIMRKMKMTSLMWRNIWLAATIQLHSSAYLCHFSLILKEEEEKTFDVDWSLNLNYS